MPAMLGCTSDIIYIPRETFQRWTRQQWRPSTPPPPPCLRGPTRSQQTRRWTSGWGWRSPPPPPWSRQSPSPSPPSCWPAVVVTWGTGGVGRQVTVWGHSSSVMVPSTVQSTTPRGRQVTVRDPTIAKFHEIVIFFLQRTIFWPPTSKKERKLVNKYILEFIHHLQRKYHETL